MQLRITLILTCLLLCVGAAAFWIFGNRSGSPDEVDVLLSNGNMTGGLRILRSKLNAQLSGVGDADTKIRQLVVQANRARQFGDGLAFEQSIEGLKEIGSDEAEGAVELLDALVQAQSGGMRENAEAQLEKLLFLNANPEEAQSAVIQGLLAKNKPKTALRMLDAWREESSESPHLNFVNALLLNANSDSEAAAEKLTQNIQDFPQHELSYLALARIVSQPPQRQIDRSISILRLSLELFPENPTVQLQLGQQLRRTGATQEAKELFEQLPEREDARLELAETLLDLGQYEQCRQALERLELAQPSQLHKLTDRAFAMTLQGQSQGGQPLSRRVNWAATALRLAGNKEAANQAFEVALDRVARLRRLIDLRVKQQLMPEAPGLAAQLDFLVAPSTQASIPTLREFAKRQQGAPTKPTSSSTYQALCSDCHGADGNGLGKSSRHLFPAPRNLRLEPMRYITTSNGIASDDDLKYTIKNGLNGVSMPAFPDLTESELAELIIDIRKFQSQNWETQAKRLVENGELSENKREAWVKSKLTPSGRVEFPRELLQQIAQAPAESAARGKAAYSRAGCQLCHSDTPNDARRPQLFHDSLGHPLLARDLTKDPMRGGDSVLQLAYRIACGIPGSPHPKLEASSKEVLDIAQYVTQITNTPRNQLTNSQRASRIRNASQPH